MRILHIAPGCSFTESYKYQENLLTEYQQKLGHDVALLTTTLMHSDNGAIIDVGKEDRILENGVRLIRSFKLNKLNRITGHFRDVYDQITDYSPDFIFVHGLCTYSMQYAVKYKKNHPEVVIAADSHQDIFNNGKERLLEKTERIRFKGLWKKWISYVSKVYGTTSWRVSYACDTYGIPREKADVLLMGVDSDALPQNPDLIRNEIRSDLGIPQNAFVFFSGGKINRHKLITEALTEFSSIENPDIFFILCGSLSDDTKEEITKIINNDARIKYLGFIDGRIINKYIYASDFGVFPGRHSVLWEEAIGCGLPCMFKKYEEHDHTDICGNCIRLDNPSQEIIGEIIKKAVEDREWYSALKENAEKAKDSLSYRAIAKKSLECALKGD